MVIARCNFECDGCGHKAFVGFRVIDAEGALTNTVLLRPPDTTLYGKDFRQAGDDLHDAA